MSRLTLREQVHIAHCIDLIERLIPTLGWQEKLQWGQTLACLKNMEASSNLAGGTK